MAKKIRKLIAGALACIMVGASFAACGTASAQTTESSLSSTTTAVTSSSEASKAQEEVKSENKLKYVFLFIGDGMSYPQFQAASDYLGAAADVNPEILKGGESLSFMEFPVAGSATTYDSSSFCPDSASTATSISTGNKTYSGVINVSEDKSTKYETIAEKLKSQLGYKIGVISTVNLNHATPAAFYAHQESRNNYYEIGLEMIESGFDYFAGGGLKKTTGDNEDKEDLYSVAEKSGYKVIKTTDEASALKADDGKAIVIGETLADSDSLSYDNDRAESEWSLKDYVSKGIEVLNNDTGFFMMVEGGKIDWACHANDAGSTIADTLAMDEAVKEAIDFYNEHPEETLILVTGDHETGGLTIGYAGTDYSTYLNNLTSQKISYAKFDEDYVAKYKEEKTDFDTVMKDVKENFGLMLSTDADATEGNTLVLTDYEVEKLKAAYEKTMTPVAEGEEVTPTQEEYVLYGTYEPLSVTITHILNNKSGINFSSYAHTGLPVAVFAQGSGQEKFEGYYDNTDIYKNMAELLGVK